ncbi:T-complex protein 1 subunit beta-like [Vigna angularis]|uniref:T-complex protein 1 subunit beta-like n=1 Tax=Phaseolus angularis TaxID=3914 RepID=UPI0022B4C958|nr:T-complex protein 1 subunit beta-like [Vigna angularis]
MEWERITLLMIVSAAGYFSVGGLAFAYLYTLKSPITRIISMSVDISKVQDDEVGDGTTSVAVLAGELLREAEKLVATKIHPMTIISGFRMAAECARNALLEKVVDNKADSGIVSPTFLSFRGSTNLESIQIIKKPGGSLKDLFLDEGFILDKKIGIGQPNRIENAKIPVANTAMDTDKVKIYGARIRVDSFYHTEFMPLCSAGQMLYFSQCIVRWTRLGAFSLYE